MFSTNSARLLAAAVCSVFLVVLGIAVLRNRDKPAAQTMQVQEQTDRLPANPEASPIPTSDATSQSGGPGVKDPADLPAIPAFRQWAETSAASGFTDADAARGMELAKARAAAMKALIQKDPAAALREALPADLRAALPLTIAAAIEQPVRKTGMCSLRIMCNHSSDAPHNECQETPILIGDGIDWNAYYGAQSWRSHLGQTVGFEGVAVESELAVQRITPASVKITP